MWIWVPFKHRYTLKTPQNPQQSTWVNFLIPAISHNYSSYCMVNFQFLTFVDLEYVHAHSFNGLNKNFELTKYGQNTTNSPETWLWSVKIWFCKLSFTESIRTLFGYNNITPIFTIFCIFKLWILILTIFSRSQSCFCWVSLLTDPAI